MIGPTLLSSRVCFARQGFRWVMVVLVVVVVLAIVPMLCELQTIETLSSGSTFIRKDIMNLSETTKQATTLAARGEEERLEFVHIPKTAGTMMEVFATKHDISWGKCHWKKSSHQCPNSGIALSRSVVFPPNPVDHRCSIHHIPPYIMFARGYENPYEGANLFAVVRNPYERFLSEYYHQHGKDPDAHDPDKLQAFAKYVFHKKNLSHSDRKSSTYYMQYCHFVPQTEFLLYPNGTQLVHNILYYESLQSDFEKLARDYPSQLDAWGPLPDKAESGKEVKHFQHKLNVANMTKRTRTLIETFYHDDFSFLGYELVAH